jgi:hypothetical protein
MEFKLRNPLEIISNKLAGPKKGAREVRQAPPEIAANPAQKRPLTLDELESQVREVLGNSDCEYSREDQVDDCILVQEEKERVWCRDLKAKVDLHTW